MQINQMYSSIQMEKKTYTIFFEKISTSRNLKILESSVITTIFMIMLWEFHKKCENSAQLISLNCDQLSYTIAHFEDIDAKFNTNFTSTSPVGSYY